MRELYKVLYIEGNPSTAYHSQTDSQTECINQEIEQYLCLYVDYRQSDWAEWLAMAKFVYNNREHSATKFSLFYVNYGRHSEGFGSISTTKSTYSVEQWVKHIKDVYELAKKSLDKAANTMKKYYDYYSSLSLQYKSGDKVLLDSRNIKTTRPTKKFNNK